MFRTEKVSPAAVVVSHSGKTNLDLGQALVGRLRIRVSGEAGKAVTIRTAEVLHNGEICTGRCGRQTGNLRRYQRGWMVSRK